jgi:ECF transporter S component (folate family)
MFRFPENKVKLLTELAVLAALCVLLSLLTIPIGTVHITLEPLPITVAALLFGPLPAAAVALVSELLMQILSYGFTATTILWLIPPVVRALIIGFAAARFRKRDKYLEEHPLWCYVFCVAAAVATTFLNTGVIWLDSVIYGYFTPAYVFGNLLIRFGVGMLTAVITATLAMPLVRLLKKQKLV